MNNTESKSGADVAIKFSKHANQRLQKRGLELSAETLAQLATAVNSLACKGGRSSLVMLDQLALLVSVTKRTVITVIGREQLQENVFTDIDSVIFVSV